MRNGGMARRGLTLVEILLVVVVLGITASMVLPNLGQSYGQVQLQTTVSDLAYLMRYSQSRAVIQKNSVRLNFADPPQAYWLEETPSENEDSQDPGVYQQVRGRLGRAYKIPEQVTVTPSSTAIVFYADGTIDPVQIQVCRVGRCLEISTQVPKNQVKILDDSEPENP